MKNFNKIPDVTAAMQKATTKALEAVGLHIEGNAIDLVPVDTGRLRDSIHHDVDSSKQEVQIGTNVEYAAAVEFGHKQRPQPYLRPALNDDQDRVQKLFAKIIKEGIEDALR